MLRYLERFRAIWMFLDIFFILMAGFLIAHLWEEFLESPTYITLDSNLPITEVYFPGVSVCPLNKISKARALEFANSILQSDKDSTLDEILHNIQVLGNLYDFNVGDIEETQRLQDVLEKFDNITATTDPTFRMYDLSSRCGDILKKCLWGGKEFDCTDIFKTRLTHEGFCCTFNYARKSVRENKYGNITYPTEVLFAKGTGPENGLKLTLANNLDDYFFTTTETTGFLVNVFYPKDFPDKLSGSLNEIIVNFDMEAMIGLDVAVIRPTDSLNALPSHMSKCKFEGIHVTDFGAYRESDCMVACKIKYLKALCHCIPFFIPLESDLFSKYGYCTVMHLSCLNKYTGKLSKYQPDVDISVLKHDLYNSMECDECLPACYNIDYSMFPNINPIYHKKNHTLINIYFNNPFANVYQIDLTETWYEILSNFGGIMALFVGISFTSVIEIFVLIYKIVFYFVNEYE